MPEPTRLKKSIDGWWPEIAILIGARATNAKTEAANVMTKHIKRTGSGYRSQEIHPCGIMLYNAARSAALTPRITRRIEEPTSLDPVGGASSLRSALR